jgi:hypothetical protein
MGVVQEYGQDAQTTQHIHAGQALALNDGFEIGQFLHFSLS